MVSFKKSFITPILITIGSLGCLKSNAPKNISSSINHFTRDKNLITLVTDTFSRKISDENKIITYNQLLKKYHKPVDNYIIVDKKNCIAKVYNPEGEVLYKTEVALGRTLGDKRNAGYMMPEIKEKSYTTTPGEFIISGEGTFSNKEKKIYGNRCLRLNGDHTKSISKGHTTLALHRVPATPQGKLRASVFNNGTLEDNRVSFGCVNFLVESYDKLRKLIKGKGTKVFILPEENGNSLHLEKQKDGTYKFFQTKYRYESQEHNKK